MHERIPHGANGVGRTLPHDLAAEEYLLSTILQDNGGPTLERAIEAGIRPESFYDAKHGIAFEGLLNLRKSGTSIEEATLALHLKDTRLLEQVGGFAFITQISSRVPTTAGAAEFIKNVREHAMLREVITAATKAVEDAYNFAGGNDLEELTSDLKRRLDFATAKRSHLPKRSSLSFRIPAADDPSILLGNSYLCRGDGLVLVSSSGMGKSSISLQAASTWALGRPFFGVRPNGPLRSLVIQSEDGEGDVAEVMASIRHKLKLTPEEAALVDSGVTIVTDRIHRGQAFLDELKRLLATGNYDLVWINPLAAYLQGDGTTAEAAGDFLRAGLNALNEPPRFAYIVVHHTTKPATGKQRGEDRRWHEVMYDMAGSYDIIGWARAIISLRPTETQGEFNLVLAKRGSRAGVTKKIPQGTGYRLEHTTTIPIKHSGDKMKIPDVDREIPVIFWEAREDSVVAADEQPPERSMGRPKKNSFADFKHIFPTGAANALGVNQLLQAALLIRHIAKGTMYAIIDEGLDLKAIVCNAANPKAPSYYIPLPSAAEKREESESDEPLFEPDGAGGQ